MGSNPTLSATLFFENPNGASAVNVIPFYYTYPMRSTQLIDDNRVQEFSDALFRLERLHFS